jgi:nucleotide-binding universal stress UspA family protein
MFRHLMAPLDGSHTAESALAPAVDLALAMGAELTLLHVIEESPPGEIHGEHHLTSLASAQRYLEGLAAGLPPALKCSVHVHPNKEHNVSRSIVEHAREFDVDLIVLCTHGRSSPRRWLYGTIAQQVIALGRIPVLVTNPSGHVNPYTGCRRILTPLDGNPDHEAGISTASEIARACGASVHVVIVIPTVNTLSMESSATARLLPSAMRAALDMSQEKAMAYLASQVATLVERQIDATGVVRRGEPVVMIAQEAQASRADLIVMATHGKSHLDAFWEGSVAPTVSARTSVPLVLVPVREPDRGG